MSFRLHDGVTFAYPGGPVILRRLDLELCDGQTVVLLGRSGLGKTTLLNLLALLWDRGLSQGRIVYTSPRTGRAWDYNQLRPVERARLRREEFGLVPQTAHFLSGFTCGQNLRIPLSLQGFGHQEAHRRVEQLLELARDGHNAGGDLGGVLRRYPVQVSTGQRQRLSVLRAILHDPAVLFADEPVSNLDGENRDLMLRLFRRWQRNELLLPDHSERQRTLFLISHEAEVAFEMADSFLFLTPPGPGEPDGVMVELISRPEFCRQNGIDGDSPEARWRAAEAIRGRLGGMSPTSSSSTAPAAAESEAS